MPGKVHVVCLDAPAPPDYGGAIDMYYKVKAFAESGREVVLHYFDYRAGRSAAGLERFCSAIHAYPRKSFLPSVWNGPPYITGSRNSGALLNRLRQDSEPVLLEGVHCAGIIPYLYGTRKLVLRMHNDEAAYYSALAHTEKSLKKSLYFRLESRLLHRFQKRLPKDLPLACVALNDQESLRSKYGFTQLEFVPSFTPWQRVEGRDGRGDYCLYHGNLSVAENSEAAIWLLQNVFTAGAPPLVIAGKSPSYQLAGIVATHANARLVSNPTDSVLEDLVRGAQIHVLPSFNTTGLKLKLLHALFLGRHCITNGAGVAGTEFAGAVQLAEDAAGFRSLVNEMWGLPFSASDREARAKIADVYSNKKNIARLNAWL